MTQLSTFLTILVNPNCPNKSACTLFPNEWSNELYPVSPFIFTMASGKCPERRRVCLLHWRRWLFNHVVYINISADTVYSIFSWWVINCAFQFCAHIYTRFTFIIWILIFYTHLHTYIHWPKKLFGHSEYTNLSMTFALHRKQQKVKKIAS